MKMGNEIGVLYTECIIEAVIFGEKSDKSPGVF